jgi:TonB family protein
VYRARPGARGGPALTAVFTRDGVEHHLILHAQGNERVGLEVLSRFEGDEARNSSVFSVLAKETPGGALRLTGTPAPVRVGGAIREPVKLKDVRPDYPQEARRERIQGLIVLECTIGPDGRVVEARPLQGEHQILIDAAIEAVKQWRYAPTLVNGVAVPIIMTVTVNFKLS